MGADGAGAEGQEHAYHVMSSPWTNRFSCLFMYVFFAAILPLMAEEGEEKASLETTSVKGGLEVNYLSDREYPEITITQFAYGSCNKPERVSQKFWDVILENNPQLMLLLGDQHYVNSNDPVDHKAAFQQLDKIEGYSKMRSLVPTFAIWDNHDYAKGYRGKNHPNAEAVEEAFLEGNRVPLDCPRRSRAGVYGSWIFGKKPNRVQVIMLDSHRHRDALSGRKAFSVNEDSQMTILGKEQWKWLDQQLKREAEVRVIGSSNQVISNEHTWQRWGVFPHERQRLLEMLAKAKGTSVILSGDRHRGEIARFEQAGSKPICEITASGWAQTYDRAEPNKFRIKGPTAKNHYGWMSIDWKNLEIKNQILSTEDSAVILEHVEKIGQ